MTTTNGMPAFVKMIIAGFAIYGAYCLLKKLFEPLSTTSNGWIISHQAGMIDDLALENAELHRKARFRAIISDFLAKFLAKLAWEAIKDRVLALMHFPSPFLVKA